MSSTHLLSIADLDATTLGALMEHTVKIKADPRRYQHALDDVNVALINEKQSLRTRVTFELGVHGMGGYCIVLSGQDFVLGKRESVPDIARNLERWVHMVVARVYLQETLADLAQWGSIPVINALSDLEHPCQALADFFTLHERGLRGSDVRLAYVGDGNNVCHSLMLFGALVGSDVRVASPPGYAPDGKVVETAQAFARESGGRIWVGEDPYDAVRGANAIYTDVWTSMGQEAESDRRRKVFADYQVNNNLTSVAEPGAYIMHCLPAHRGEEITDEVLDSEQSVVFDQAENRMHAQKAAMLYVLNRL